MSSEKNSNEELIRKIDRLEDKVERQEQKIEKLTTADNQEKNTEKSNKVSRRNFVKMLGLGAGGLALSTQASAGFISLQNKLNSSSKANLSTILSNGEDAAEGNIKNFHDLVAGKSDSALLTGGGGTDYLTIYDNANDQQLMKFNEGGPVTIPNTSLTIEGSVTAENTWNKQIADLSSQSDSNWYPVSLENPPTNEKLHYFTISGHSAGGSDPYNNNTMTGYARGGGYTDRQHFASIELKRYDDNENTIYGIYEGEEAYTDVVVYLRGGQIYQIYTPSEVTLHTSDYSSGNSTFQAGVSSPSGTKISSVMSIHDKSSGKYTTQGVEFGGNLDVSGDVNFKGDRVDLSQTQKTKISKYSGSPPSLESGDMWIDTSDSSW